MRNEVKEVLITPRKKIFFCVHYWWVGNTDTEPVLRYFKIPIPNLKIPYRMPILTENTDKIYTNTSIYILIISLTVYCNLICVLSDVIIKTMNESMNE